MAESNILTREVAGIPVGVWGVVVAGGLGIAYFINRGQSEPDVEREPLTDPGVGTGLVPAGSAIQPGNQSDSDDGGFENNSQWAQAAKSHLIGQGNDPTLSGNAVSKYVGGDPNASLTVQENALIQTVLIALGPPPDDIPVIGVEEPGEEPEGRRIPRLVKEPGDMTPQPVGTRPHFSGRVYYEQDGQEVSPGRTLVQITTSMWAKSTTDPRMFVVAHRQYVETAEDGTWSVRVAGVKNREPGWRRRYVFTWPSEAGIQVQDRVKFV